MLWQQTQARRQSYSVFAVDFDGVLCDTAAEMGVTAWRAGAQLWPAWQGPEPPSEFLSRFQNLRPVLETGYQAIFLMRLVYAGVDDETIEREFPQLCIRLLYETACSTAELVHLFGQTRDTWIAHDLDDWLSRHSFYPQVIETFAARVKSDPVFILTTKQERFVTTLLQSRGIRLPGGHVFGLDAGKSKEEVLEQLSRRPIFEGARFHFVEDRLQTLIRILGRSTLTDVRLYLADWGYNTSRDREKAESIPRITIWKSETFLEP